MLILVICIFTQKTLLTPLLLELVQLLMMLIVLPKARLLIMAVVKRYSFLVHLSTFMAYLITANIWV